MKQFFVTGGAGFIGSAFARLLLDAYPDCEIVNFDALTYAGNLDNLAGLDERRHHFIRGDAADREAVRAALPENADAIFHLAAESHVDRSILSADEFIRANVLGTQVLLDAARERGARRVVFISTDEVMGSANRRRQVARDRKDQQCFRRICRRGFQRRLDLVQMSALQEGFP